MKKLFKSVAFWIVLIVVIAVALIASQRLKQAEQAKNLDPVERPPMSVRAVKAHRGSVQEFVMGEGTARTVRREFLNFEASGKVIFIDKDLDGGELREGSQVYGPKSGQQLGQLLAQLDQREILAAISMDKADLEQARQNVNVAYATVTQAENEYDLAEADFDRFTRHSEEGTTLALYDEKLTQAKETVTAAEAAVAQAESDFKLAKTELARTEKLSKSGASLKTFEEALNQARQNVTSAEAGVAKAQNDYDLVKTNFEKSEELHKEGIISKTKYDEAQTQYRNAEAALKTANANFQAAQSQAKNAANELEKAKINVPVTELATAQAGYRSAEAAVKTATANLKTTKSQVKTASTQLDQAKIDVPIVEYEAAKAKYLNAEAALETAVANLHVAHSQVEASLARLRQAELNMERTSIFAPFDGIITYLNIKIGDYITPQTMDKSTEQAMMQTAPIVLIDPSTYEITLNLPAYVGSAVQVEQPAFIVSSADTFPEEPEEFQVEYRKPPNKPELDTRIEPIPMAQGKVYSVSPSISPGGRSIQIKIRTTEGTEYLQDGMFVSAKIIAAEKSHVVTLPGNCLIFRKDKAYVFVADSQTGIVTRRPVVDGIGNIRKWEVIDGVKEGEFVVTEGRYRLVDGAKVEILNMEQEKKL
ncbi:MAG: efflux RND transporter periplasmic adaptor subunit [bacterium]|nr:efflux RND transporter periplasmic adaptor subunit [bacterium]